MSVAIVFLLTSILMAGSVYRVPLHLHKDRNGMSGSDVWMYRKFMGIVYLLSHLISHNARPQVGKLLHNTQQWEDYGEIIMHFPFLSLNCPHNNRSSVWKSLIFYNVYLPCIYAQYIHIFNHMATAQRYWAETWAGQRSAHTGPTLSYDSYVRCMVFWVSSDDAAMMMIMGCLSVLFFVTIAFLNRMRVFLTARIDLTIYVLFRYRWLALLLWKFVRL